MSGRFVNKALLDYENRFNLGALGNKQIQIIIYSGNELIQDMRKFVEVIYRNFGKISTERKLNHTRKSITRLLTSYDSVLIIAYDVQEKKIVSYIVGEITFYNKMKLMHIYYLFVSPDHRQKGLGSKMLDTIEKYTEKLNIKYMSLTFDTHNKNLYDFYTSHGFKFDSKLRSYSQYDMLMKKIHI
jgi:ribosomal protein S18 acetylase RimI-like enzyme